MIKSVEAETLRDYIEQKDDSLSSVLNYLWNISRDVHALQNDANGTENGRGHVEAVERNIWRLINETGRFDEFQVKELFVLSVAACCHDFDKALKKYYMESRLKVFRHGADSADFLRNNLDILGLIKYKHLAENAAKIIAIHDLNGEEFAKEVKGLRKKKATYSGAIRHRLLAVLLKAADVLHTDESRIQKVGVDLSALEDTQKSKYHARSSIEGWIINGDHITIQATVTTEEQQNAIIDCEDFMVNTEWLVIGECLENYDYPHVLEFDIEDRLSTGEQPMPTMNEDQTAGNVPVGSDRFLTTDATDFFLNTALKHVERFPLCRHLASSHAAGAAVISLAVLIMRDKLKGLKNTFKNNIAEMVKEYEYTPRKFVEHIGWLTKML